MPSLPAVEIAWRQVEAYTERYRALRGQDHAAVTTDMLLALFRPKLAALDNAEEASVTEEGPEAKRAETACIEEEAASSGREALAQRIVTLVDGDEDGVVSLFEYLQARPTTRPLEG